MSNWMLDILLGVADAESHNDVSDREDIVSTPARARRPGRRMGANPGARSCLRLYVYAMSQ